MMVAQRGERREKVAENQERERLSEKIIRNHYVVMVDFNQSDFAYVFIISNISAPQTVHLK